jgi:hypothetical protein
MAWEEIRAKATGRGMPYGHQWFEVPCVAVTKQGLTLNAMYCDVFEIEPKSRVFILFDRERHAIGIRKSVNGEPIDGSYTVTRNTGKSNRPTLTIACADLAKRIADCRGMAFRARLNPSERVVEVLLDQSNQTR